MSRVHVQPAGGWLKGFMASVLKRRRFITPYGNGIGERPMTSIHTAGRSKISCADRTTTVAEALHLHGLGYEVAPGCAPITSERCSSFTHTHPQAVVGKVPLAVGFMDAVHRRMTADDLAAMVERAWPCNILIVIRGGLVVVEADSREAQDELERFGGAALSKTPCREGRDGRGRAYILRSTSTLPEPVVHAGKSKKIDVLTTGCVLVVPPSTHWSGHRYQWHVPPWEIAPAEMPDALEDLYHRGRWMNSLVPGWLRDAHRVVASTTGGHLGG